MTTQTETGALPAADAVMRARAALMAGDRDVALADLTIAAEHDAGAAQLLATLYAAGAWVAADWPRALDHLQRAATLGSVSAQGQLDLLAPGGADWAAKRAAIDLDTLLSLPARVPLCEAPRVRLAEGFLTPAQCDWLVAVARPRLQPAKMVEGYGADPRYVPERTNSDYAFTVFEADCIVALARHKMSLLLKIPSAHFEPPQIFHYAPGEELKLHVDYLQRPDRPRAAYDGDRIATFLIYLNDDFEGGETWFPRGPLKTKAPKGGALYFANVGLDNAPDPTTLHAGLPPTRGEKFLFSQWIHDRPFTG